jgi:hypothetical protein
MYRLEIQKLLLQIEDNYEDIDLCIALLKQAIQIADKNNDIDWAFDLRLYLIREERSTSHCRESMVAFAWLLEQCDEQKDRFDERELLLEYQWMICSAYSNSSIPLEQIDALLQDLTMRLERTHSSKRGLYYTLAGFNMQLGNPTKAKEYIALSDLEPFDEEFTEATSYDNHIENAVCMKEFDRAVELMDQMEYKKLTAFSLPFETYAAMACFMARAKDSRATLYAEKAKEQFEQISEINSSLLYSMTRLSYALYLLNDESVWHYYEKMADWEVEAEDDLQLMMSRHYAMICSQGGEKKLTLSIKVPFFQESGVYNLSELASYYSAKAHYFAKAFDQRNGNNFYQNELLILSQEKTSNE